MNQETTRRVLIGTPCYDGKIDAWYANSLLNTVKLSQRWNIEIFPIYLSYDALIQRARNDLMSIMISSGFDDLVFIDADIEWQPDDFFKLLSYSVDVVGGTYPKKGDDEIYVAKILDITQQRDLTTGLLPVQGLGTGFLRLSRRAALTLWENSIPYTEKDTNKSSRMVFDITVNDGELISEDINVCNKLTALGIPVYLDTSITCNHIGMKKYTGNFDSWFSKLQMQQAPKLEVDNIDKSLFS